MSCIGRALVRRELKLMIIIVIIYVYVSCFDFHISFVTDVILTPNLHIVNIVITSEYNREQMSPASIGGGFHLRASAAVQSATEALRGFAPRSLVE